MTQTITDIQIEALRIEAGEHFDQTLVDTCTRALAGDDEAQAEVVEVLADAAAERHGLHAVVLDDTHCVRDESGAVWWPDEDAAAEIASALAPGSYAVLMCEQDPMRGEWRS